MLRLLEIEYLKLWNSRASRVLIISYFILLTSIALIAAIKFDIGPVKFHLAEQGIFNFPYIWHFNSYVAGFFKLFLAIVIVSMMANEYSNKTLKQNLIDGLSKREFIFSKFITVLVFSGISTLFVFIVTLILGFIYSDFTELSIVFSDLEFLLAFFIKLVGFFSFCLFLGILVKRSAFALGFLFIWFFLEQIIFGLLGWRLDSYEKAQQIKDFFPLEAMANLLKEPASRMAAVQSVANQMGQSIPLDYQVEISSIVIVLFYTIVFIWGSLKILQKRDL